MKIVLVGAGSREFGPATIRDILLSDPLCDGGVEVALVDIDPSGLPRAQAYAEAVAERLGRSATVSASTQVADTLPGADAVILSIEINRYFHWAQDFHVPRSFGFRQIYGENGGPGGLFHALRNMGPTIEVARAMETHCPDAWLVNYTNPLTRLCEAVGRLTDVRVVGLCHGVFHGVEQMARLLDLPPDRLDARASGLNHFSWFESVRDRETGEDLYPRLSERERTADWLHDWDEIALSRTLFRVFGRFPSPGANHIGEYIRWAGDFLASSSLQFFYDPTEGHPWETGEVPTWIYNLGDHPTETPLFPDKRRERARGSREERAGEVEQAPLKPSGELAAPLLEGVLSGEERYLDAINVPNAGHVPGLPDGAVVEVPALADGSGLHPMQMARLPEGILALLRTQTSITRLLVDAFKSGSRRPLLQALLLDPTTESYRQAVGLINEMCRLQQDVLPRLEW
ncbi:MAG: alpha-galactosidase [Gemmatimonadetes bacterium]|nr:alpha-galactosidase [Gemmatimonadota bacterium]